MKNVMSFIVAGLVACSAPGLAQTLTPDVCRDAPRDAVQDARADMARDLAHTVLSDARAQGQEKVPDNVLVDVQPSVIKRVEPVYPKDALAKGSEGKVWLKILVDTEGKPAQVEVLKSENEYFDQASITAARQWMFSPALKDNKPVAVWITLPFKFKLADKEGGASARTSTPQGPPQAEELMKKVELVFAGDGAARAAIGPEAYLVDGRRFVSLHEALFGKEKGKCFAGESKRKSGFMKLTMADDGASAVLVLRTENGKKGDPRWHTIAWGRDNGGEWKITHWHTSR